MTADLTADGDAGDADASYHSLILQGLAMRDAGFAARRAEVFALLAQGHRPPAIARELARRARAEGRTDHEIKHRLGISEHNVRLIRREWPGWVAERGEGNV